MSIETLPCIRINCKSLLNAVAPFRCLPSVATWSKDKKASDYRDIFTVYDHGEGPDMDTMPEVVRKMITDACQKAGVEYAVIWLADVEEE